MIELPLPRRTKNVPITEVMMHAAPIASGSIIAAVWSSPTKKMEASTIVATTVTA